MKKAKKACAFTGHRPKKLPWGYDEEDVRCVALKAVLERQIYSLVQEGVTDFLSGMAEGVDLLAAEIVLSLRAEYPSIKLHCILPYKGQETEWFAASQARYPGDIPVTFSGFCIRFRKADEDVLLDYLLRLLKLPEIRAKMAGRGANIQNLNQKILASLPVPIPPKNLQEAYIQITKQSDKAKSTLQNTITSLQATKRSILESALGTGRKE